MTKRYQLYRFGNPYASWGTKDEVIKRAELSFLRPWIVLRLLGWSVKEEKDKQA